MINEFLWPELKDMDVDDVYFQHDGATCQTSGETIALLREKFPVFIINQNESSNMKTLHMFVYKMHKLLFSKFRKR